MVRTSPQGLIRSGGPRCSNRFSSVTIKIILRIQNINSLGHVHCYSLDYFNSPVNCAYITFVVYLLNFASDLPKCWFEINRLEIKERPNFRVLNECVVNLYCVSSLSSLFLLVSRHVPWEPKKLSSEVGKVKFIYSEKVTKFCKISTVDLTFTT